MPRTIRLSGDVDAAAAGPGAGADPRARDRRRRAAANAGHHARLVRLRRPHRGRADFLRHDCPRAASRPDASGRSLDDVQGGRGVHLRQAGPHGSRSGRGRRHRGRGRARGGRNRRHDQRRRRSPRPAAGGGRRADAANDLQHQQLAAGRPRRKVRHQPPPARSADERAGAKRGPARRRRSQGTDSYSRFGPRPAAPERVDRDHAPRRLRTVGRQAASDLARSQGRDRRAVRVADRRSAARQAGRRDGAGRRAARASWSK